MLSIKKNKKKVQITFVILFYFKNFFFVEVQLVYTFVILSLSSIY